MPNDAPTRRAVMGAAAVLAAGAWARAARAGAPPPAKAEKPLKLLVLGGTRFLGPAIVDHALARGHAVTLFNRGRSNPGMYPDLERLHGDRGGRGPDGTPVAPDLAALEGRHFDACLDTSGYWPEHVAASSRLLAGLVQHYVFVSTISVYPGFGTSNTTLDETSSLGALKPREAYTGFEYGPFKALCERAVEAAMPGRAAHVRPGLIVGPRDASDRFTWWPVRVHRGGEILAPGDGTSPCQFIDVRDLGAFLVHLVERGTTGVFNATGFDGRLSLMEFLHGCKCAVGTRCSFAWVDEAFLEAQGVAPFSQLPLWLPAKGLPYVEVGKALGAGLALRPVAQTVQDTLAWWLADRQDGRLARGIGLPAARESALLSAWRERATPR